MILRIRSVTGYHYAEAVSFSPHVVRLFPRQDHALKVRAFSFETNGEASVQFRRDVFDNVMARCFYPDAATDLRFALEMEISVAPRNPFEFLLEPGAVEFPFGYSATEAATLGPYLATGDDGLPGVLPLPGAIAEGRAADTVEALVEFARAIAGAVAYEEREEGEAMSPGETLARGKGACRDSARLAASILRRRGIAVRLVSGFLSELHLPPGKRRAEGSLHAWIEAFLPGAGWIGLDPTHGVLCDHCFVPAAVGVIPEDIAPVSGSFFSDHPVPCLLDTSVRITEADA